MTDAGRNTVGGGRGVEGKEEGRREKGWEGKGRERDEKEEEVSVKGLGWEENFLQVTKKFSE